MGIIIEAARQGDTHTQPHWPTGQLGSAENGQSSPLRGYPVVHSAATSGACSDNVIDSCESAARLPVTLASGIPGRSPPISQLAY